MNMGIIPEALLLAGSFSCGIAVLLCYDIILAIRTAAFRAGAVSAITDILFWGISGTLTFYMMYNMNAGRVRFYAIAGVISGMLLYHNTVSALLRRSLVRLFRSLLRLMDRLLIKPAAFLIKRLKKAVLYAIMRIKKLLTAKSVGCRSSKPADGETPDNGGGSG